MVQNNEQVKQNILNIAVQELPNTSLSLSLALQLYIPVNINMYILNSIIYIYDCGILWLVYMYAFQISIEPLCLKISKLKFQTICMS